MKSIKIEFKKGKPYKIELWRSNSKEIFNIDQENTLRNINANGDEIFICKLKPVEESTYAIRKERKLLGIDNLPKI